MYAAGLTATGIVRSQNEDAIFHTTEPIGPLPNLFVVADGMGGHSGGEVASQKSIEYCCGFINDAPTDANLTPDKVLELLVAATSHANVSVNKHAANNPTLLGMGTTFSVCVLLGDILAVAHVGDSRIYTISQGEIAQITTDHSYVEEMVASGHLTPDQAKTHPKRNQLTRSLGFEPDVAIDSSLHDLQNVDSLLLCSDGLSNMLTNDEIANFLGQNTSTHERAQALVDAANNHGGIDNISVIIIDVKGERY